MVVTNVAAAGATLWVLFSTVLLNQILQDHRSEIDRRTSRFTRPLRRLKSVFRSGGPIGSAKAQGLVGLLGVLLLTGLIYTILEPGVGMNRATLVLLLSLIVGVGLATYLTSGLEAWMTTRVTGVPAAVRPFPAAIAVAAVAVAISRLVDFHPGVIYGFVASCAILGPAAAGEREAGRIAFVPVVAVVVLSIGAWLLVAPIRSAPQNDATALAESIAVIIFIGGIEGLLFSMIPIAATDGGKIFRWSRWVWALLAIVSAFLAWHVLLGRERAYFSGLRETRSVAVVAVFLAYSALTIGLWAYFRFRRTATELTAG